MDEEEMCLATMNNEVTVQSIGLIGENKKGMFSLSSIHGISVWDLEKEQRVFKCEDLRKIQVGINYEIEYAVDCKSNKYSNLSCMVGDEMGRCSLLNITPNNISLLSNFHGDGHNERVRSFEWSDDNIIYTGGEDSRLCVWKWKEQSNPSPNFNLNPSLLNMKKNENLFNPY